MKRTKAMLEALLLARDSECARLYAEITTAKRRADSAERRTRLMRNAMQSAHDSAQLIASLLEHTFSATQL
jgi:hypothetical protein